LQQLDLVLPWLAGFHDHLTLAANTTPSGAPAWKTLPRWAVIGTEDRIIPPGAQRRMAERAGATITEVNASHVSMVSRPEVSIAVILAAVAAVGDRAQSGRPRERRHP
jgi:pimeloyl-ACP methyl ester carboxylesterase